VSARARGGASRPSTAAHRSSSFLELRWSVFDKVCVSHARAVRPAGLHRIRPEANFQLINSFFFKSVLKITNQFEFKSNLNFNDFYSHNKLQEHFINPRKICNGMNATINYKNLNGFNNFRK
jgi:hypothetical protein